MEYSVNFEVAKKKGFTYCNLIFTNINSMIDITFIITPFMDNRCLNNNEDPFENFIDLLYNEEECYYYFEQTDLLTTIEFHYKDRCLNISNGNSPCVMIKNIKNFASEMQNMYDLISRTRNSKREII